MRENVIKAVNEVETLDKELAQVFMKKRLITKEKAVSWCNNKEK